MKSHILISMHYLELGGAETALIGLLQALDPKRVDVDLFLYDHRGEMMKFVPEWVHILPPNKKYKALEQPISSLLKERLFGMAVTRVLAKLYGQYKYKISGSHFLNAISECYVADFLVPFLPLINGTNRYDLAISFLTPHQYVLHNVHAKKKLAWIHTDYTRIAINVKRELKVWNKFDNIVSISDDVTKTFLQRFPTLSPKILKIENILSPAFVRIRAEEFTVDWETEDVKMGYASSKSGHGKTWRILTIGRFAEPKNLDNLPFICQSLIENSIDVQWYIIGYGPDEQLVRRKIGEAGMEKHVIILGKKENPYPYIKACDIYIQPSRYEGKSVTVREAQMLCKPVVVTNYPTAGSQIQDGEDGVIVPMDNEGCAKGISDLIKDIEKQHHIISFLEKHDYGNTNEVNKIYNILGL